MCEFLDIKGEKTTNEEYNFLLHKYNNIKRVYLENNKYINELQSKLERSIALNEELLKSYYDDVEMFGACDMNPKNYKQYKERINKLKGE